MVVPSAIKYLMLADAKSIGLWSWINVRFVETSLENLYLKLHIMIASANFIPFKFL